MDKAAASCLLSIAAALARLAANALEARAHCEELAAALGDTHRTLEAAPAPKPTGGAAHRRGGYVLHGQRISMQGLADAAGCTLSAMQYRINVANMAPEEAVACGKRKVRTDFYRKHPKRPDPAPAVAPPAVQFPRSVFDAPKAPPAPAVTGVRVTPPPQQAFRPGQEVIVPDGVKRTIASTPRGRFEADEAARTFGRIGEYEDSGSAMSRALAERRP